MMARVPAAAAALRGGARPRPAGPPATQRRKGWREDGGRCARPGPHSGVSAADESIEFDANAMVLARARRACGPDGYAVYDVYVTPLAPPRHTSSVAASRRALTTRRGVRSRRVAATAAAASSPTVPPPVGGPVTV
eukprot:gene23838-37449_t